VWAALVIAAAAVAFWYACLILPAWEHPFAANLGNVDFFTQIYPMSVRGAALFREGTFPLWNPFQFAGHPFLATALYGVCYPPNVVYLLLPTALAIEVVVVLHLALAGWFTYLYASAVGIRSIGAATGAAVYMFCGFMASQAGWFTPAVASSTWLPLALLAVERLVERPAGRSAALLAAAVALALLGGWTQFWLYSMYALGIYAGARVLATAWHEPTRARVPRIVVLLGIAVGLGIAVTALQLLPTYELQRLGPRRPGGLSLEQLIPLGSSSPALLVAQSLDWRSAAPYLDMYYLGPVVLALVAFSALSRRGVSRLLAIWLLFIASCLVCVGTYTPFFEHVYLKLPAAGWFRAPQRIAFLAAFTAALLAAYGVDALSSPGRAHRGVAVVIGLAMLAGGVAVLLGRAPVPVGELVIVATAMVLVVGAVFAPHGRLHECLVGCLLVLVVADYVRGTHNVFRHPFHGTEPLDRQAAILRYVHDHQGLDRTYLHDASSFDYSVTGKQGSLREIYSITDYEPLSLLRFSEFYALMNDRVWKYPFTGMLTLDPGRRSLLDVLSVRYAVVRSNVPLYRALAKPESPWREVAVASHGPYRLLEHSAPLPRAYLTMHATVIGDGKAGLAALTAAEFDARKTVIVEQDVGLPPAPPGSSSTPTAIAPAAITRYSPLEVVIEAEAPAPGYLVLTDTYYPGWNATVDGGPVPIYPANHVVRAVPITAGRHIVVFRYEPMSVRVGAWISGVALLAIAGLALSDKRHTA
jgi:hypothetical protein